MSKVIGLAEKRCQTAFVGALAEFEEHFGCLWGHGRRGPQTADEKRWEAVWQACRNRVLTNGNNQLRALRALAEEVKGE